MKPFLCVQPHPRDLFKTKAMYSAGREQFTAACFQVAPSFFFSLTKQAVFSCCLGLVGSCAFCVVYNLLILRFVVTFITRKKKKNPKAFGKCDI